MVYEYKNHPYTTSVGFFLILSLITLGIYEIYWVYTYWKFVQEKNNLKIHSFWRSIFSIIFIHSLFTNLFEIVEKEKGYVSKYPPSLLAIGYVVGFLLMNIPIGNLSIYMLFLIVGTVMELGIFVPVIRHMNHY